MRDDDDLVEMIMGRFVNSVQLQDFLSQRIWGLFQERKRALHQSHAAEGRGRACMKDFRLPNWGPMQRSQLARLVSGESYYARCGENLWQLMVIEKLQGKNHYQRRGDPVQGPEEYIDTSWYRGREQ